MVAREPGPTVTNKNGTSGDPKPTTTEQVLRENYWLREVVETRLNAMDKALQLLQAQADKVPSETDKAVSGLKDLLFEKFKGTDTQFLASKEAVASALAAAKEAVAAALSAVKEANTKTENFTTKQIDSMKELIDAKGASTDKSLSDLKERVDRTDGQTVGVRDNVTDTREVRRDSNNLWGLVAGTAIAGLALLFVIIDKFAAHP
jgi:hypothetical protein